MKIILAIMTIATLNAYAYSTEKVIYGDDNRLDVKDSTNAMFVELAHSTAGMVRKSSLSTNGDGTIAVSGSTLSQRGMCKSERFANQPTAANCSGFLVGEDLLVTAGHCIRNSSDCKNWMWVFDYKMEHEGQRRIILSKESVFSCKKVINTVYNSKDDFALIQLDRKVKDRRVLNYRKQGKITEGTRLVVIGHPSGLPTKIADGSTVRSLKGKYFQADLDTYGGNSGSAVFNADTGVVEGILVRGETDYIYNSSKGCKESNVLGQGEGRGEDVTYITNIPELQ